MNLFLFCDLVLISNFARLVSRSFVEFRSADWSLTFVPWCLNSAAMIKKVKTWKFLM